MTEKEYVFLNRLLEVDFREYPKQTKNLYPTELINHDLTYIDLELYHDSGLVWNYAEKTYNMKSAINFIIFTMQMTFPDFGLQGDLLARGERIDDVYKIVINSKTGYAEIIELDFIEKQVKSDIKSAYPLEGKWSYIDGELYCDNIRIARESFDIPQSNDFKKDLFTWMRDKLNNI